MTGSDVGGFDRNQFAVFVGLTYEYCRVLAPVAVRTQASDVLSSGRALGGMDRCQSDNGVLRTNIGGFAATAVDGQQADLNRGRWLHEDILRSIQFG